MIVYMWEIGMGEIRKQECFTFKGGGCLGQFSGTEIILVHFLDGYKTVAEKRIFRFVDCSESTSAYLVDDGITRVEQVGRDKRANSLTLQNGSVYRCCLNM